MSEQSLPTLFTFAAYISLPGYLGIAPPPHRTRALSFTPSFTLSFALFFTRFSELCLGQFSHGYTWFMIFWIFIGNMLCLNLFTGAVFNKFKQVSRRGTGDTRGSVGGMFRGGWIALVKAGSGSGDLAILIRVQLTCSALNAHLPPSTRLQVKDEYVPPPEDGDEDGGGSGGGIMTEGQQVRGSHGNESKPASSSNSATAHHPRAIGSLPNPFATTDFQPPAQHLRPPPLPFLKPSRRISPSHPLLPELRRIDASAHALSADSVVEAPARREGQLAAPHVSGANGGVTVLMVEGRGGEGGRGAA